MSFATAYASMCRANDRHGFRQPANPQAAYDAVLRAAQNPLVRALRLAREARFAGMRAK